VDFIDKFWKNTFQKLFLSSWLDILHENGFFKRFSLPMYSYMIINDSCTNYISCHEKLIVSVLYKNKQKTRITIDSTRKHSWLDLTRLDSTRLSKWLDSPIPAKKHNFSWNIISLKSGYILAVEDSVVKSIKWPVSVDSAVDRASEKYIFFEPFYPSTQFKYSNL
jgi:hypothetical protein